MGGCLSSQLKADSPLFIGTYDCDLCLFPLLSFA